MKAQATFASRSNNLRLLRHPRVKQWFRGRKQEKTLRGRSVEGHKRNLFLPRFYENLSGVGEIGECDVVLRLFGEIADGSGG